MQEDAVAVSSAKGFKVKCLSALTEFLWADAFPCNWYSQFSPTIIAPSVTCHMERSTTFVVDRSLVPGLKEE